MAKQSSLPSGFIELVDVCTHLVASIRNPWRPFESYIVHGNHPAFRKKSLRGQYPVEIVDVGRLMCINEYLDARVISSIVAATHSSRY